MKTLYTFNNSCKVFALAILSFLLLLTGFQYANAQATKTFTIPGKNILVSYNQPSDGADTIIFTVTNKAGTALAKGDYFVIELPLQERKNYDMRDLFKRNSQIFSRTVDGRFIGKADFTKSTSFSFTSKLTPGASGKNSVQLYFSQP